MNKVILIGRLTKDPEMRYTQSAEPLAVARFTIAVNRRVKKEGEPDADFVICVSFGKQAEFVEKYIKKSMQIGVTGRLSVRSFDDASGQRRWITEVIAEEVEFTESRAAYEARVAAGAMNSSFDRAFDKAYGTGPAREPAAFSPGPASDSGSFGAAEPRPDFEPSVFAEAAPKPAFEPESLAAITESIDEDDLPF